MAIDITSHKWYPPQQGTHVIPKLFWANVWAFVLQKRLIFMKKFATSVFWLSMLACGGGSGVAISILDDVELHEVAIASTDGYLLFTSVLLAAIGSCAFIYNNASRSISFSGLSNKPFMVLGVSREIGRAHV